MALLAEEIVEEWLRRQGYFTLRGIKLGVHEIDLLAVKRMPTGAVDCRHIEVQASMRPVSFISKVPKELQRAGRAAGSAKRTSDELHKGVDEWVEKKYGRPDKQALMRRLWDGDWSRELVLNAVRHEDEVAMIAAHGIKVHRLPDIVASLAAPHNVLESASGADFVDLIQMGRQSESNQQ